MRKRSVLIIAFSDLANDPRVNRQIRLLQADFDVTAAGFTDPEIAGITFVKLPSQRKNAAGRLLAAVRLALRSYSSYYWNIDTIRGAHAALGRSHFDLVLANDAPTWPVAVSLRRQARLLFDAHEYAPREIEDRPLWRWLYGPYRYHQCRTFLPQADAIITVCAGIAAEYARVFGVSTEVVMNTPPRRDFKPAAPVGDRIRMIHHGFATPSRRIETMIQTMDHLDARFQLDLMLVGTNTAYLDSLRKLAASRPQIHFRPPVPMAKIPEATREYDIGLFLLEPTNFNYRHALPNKFFEFIQARLAVAIGPSPEMARLVRQFDCGVVAADFSPQAIASGLSALSPGKIMELKEHADVAADVLCWENEQKVLLQIVDRLLAKPCPA